MARLVKTDIHCLSCNPWRCLSVYTENIIGNYISLLLRLRHVGLPIMRFITVDSP